jgi:hypothetical protein
MEISIGQKWLCLVDATIYGDFNEIILQFKEGDIIKITKILKSKPYPYNTDVDVSLSEKEIVDSFILLADYREQRINEILEDE